MENYSGRNVSAPVAVVGAKKCELNINMKALRYMYDNFVDKTDKTQEKFGISSMYAYLTGLFSKVSSDDINESVEFITVIVESCSGGNITRNDIEKQRPYELIGLFGLCSKAFNYSIADYIEAGIRSIDTNTDDESKKKLAQMMISCLSQM